MRAGLLKDRVTLIPPAGSLDAWGLPEDGVSQEAACQIESIKVADRAANNRVLAEATCAILIRYESTVSSDWRAELNGETYGVIGFEHDPRKTWTRLFLKSRG